MTIERIIKKIQENNPRADINLVKLAYNFSETAHRGQTRKSGEPYIQHSLHTAFVLSQIKTDLSTIIAGILHDVPEDTEVTIEEVKKEFGEEIGSLVEGVTKLGKIKYRGIERYRENIKKMFLAMADDIRIIFIKFADRLHNLKTLDSLPIGKQQRIARETLEIYAPIAGLLGMWYLKWQMEDICFKFLYPKEYEKVEYMYEVERKIERNQFFHKIKTSLENGLNGTSIEYKIEERFKHLYSIYQKMQKKDRKFEDIHDVFALRIIVNTVDDCYKVLGIIHSLWKPQINRFKDYIAVPKPNGYSSLHTTIYGPNGKLTEFQIRTKQMDDEANYGIAAHTNYKVQGEGKKHAQLKWVEEILEVQKEMKNTSDFIKKIKLDVFKDRIFLFSPKGDIFELPEKSTPIDFAFAVHTEVGIKAIGAKINNRIATLDQELKNGDMVEVILDKNKKTPNNNWLKSVQSKKAKEKITQYAKKSTLEKVKRYIRGSDYN